MLPGTRGIIKNSLPWLNGCPVTVLAPDDCGSGERNEEVEETDTVAGLRVSLLEDRRCYSKGDVIDIDTWEFEPAK